MLGALIANIQDGVMAEDEGGRIIVSNQAFSRMFGLPAPEALIGSCAHVIREALAGRPDGGRRTSTAT
jgi:PAS domain-containing protein